MILLTLHKQQQNWTTRSNLPSTPAQVLHFWGWIRNHCFQPTSWPVRVYQPTPSSPITPWASLAPATYGANQSARNSAQWPAGVSALVSTPILQKQKKTGDTQLINVRLPFPEIMSSEVLGFWLLIATFKQLTSWHRVWWVTSSKGSVPTATVFQMRSRRQTSRTLHKVSVLQSCDRLFKLDMSGSRHPCLSEQREIYDMYI